jgi:hypothetical protein
MMVPYAERSSSINSPGALAAADQRRAEPDGIAFPAHVSAAVVFVEHATAILQGSYVAAVDASAWTLGSLFLVFLSSSFTALNPPPHPPHSTSCSS